MEYYTNKEEETIKLGKFIGKRLNKGDTLLLSGDLGAGKTTFTKGIGNALNIKRIINSPTFTIFKSYNGDINLYHFDFYRLGDNQYDFMIEEYLDNDGITVIEWPSCYKEIIKNEYILIEITRIDDNKRKFVISSKGKKYDKIMGDLNEFNFR